MEKDKPVPIGIWVWAIYLIINGLSVFVVAVISLFKPIEFAYFMVEYGVLKPWNVIWGVGFIVLGWNVLELKNWARIISVVLGWFYVAILLLGLLVKKISIFPTVIWISLLVLFLYYLNRTSIKEVFAQSSNNLISAKK